ncbi:MAG: SRPBCC domain-containing protein [Capnocytophaga sp.]|nr:SRPBCC domain-containing protein [Capnocytophaga sp.]
MFEWIINPDYMTHYFISKSSGIMEVGKVLMWEFPEFSGEFPVKVTAITPNKSISFIWDEETVVTIELEDQPNGTMVVKVAEDGKPFSEENIQWALGNTEGWANFLACMKAYLEYGVELRKGAFDFKK